MDRISGNLAAMANKPHWLVQTVIGAVVTWLVISALTSVKRKRVVTK